MSAAPAFMATSELGEWIERKMAERGINQSQLASFLKPRTSPSVVNAWLNRGAVPSSGMCVALAHFFHVPPEEVMRRAGHLPAGPQPLEAEEEDIIIPELQLRIRRFSPAEQRRYLLPAIELAQTLREPMEGDEADPPAPDDDPPVGPRGRRR